MTTLDHNHKKSLIDAGTGPRYHDMSLKTIGEQGEYLDGILNSDTRAHLFQGTFWELVGFNR